jgi:hypothetical protein
LRLLAMQSAVPSAAPARASRCAAAHATRRASAHATPGCGAPERSGRARRATLVRAGVDEPLAEAPPTLQSRRDTLARAGAAGVCALVWGAAVRVPGASAEEAVAVAAAPAPAVAVRVGCASAFPRAAALHAQPC